MVQPDGSLADASPEVVQTFDAANDPVLDWVQEG
jgi:hypothetical protein